MLFLNSLLYVDDGTFLFSSHEELEDAAQKIYSTFLRFVLTRMLDEDPKIQNVAMFFPSTLSYTRSSTSKQIEDILI